MLRPAAIRRFPGRDLRSVPVRKGERPSRYLSPAFFEYWKDIYGCPTSRVGSECVPHEQHGLFRNGRRGLGSVGNRDASLFRAGESRRQSGEERDTDGTRRKTEAQISSAGAEPPR